MPGSCCSSAIASSGPSAVSRSTSSRPALPRLHAVEPGQRARFDLAGQVVHALPTPAALARLDRVPGLPDAALPRLHAVAEAASAGRLDVDRLTALGPDEAMAALQQLPGIGAFYSALVVVRACGLTDVLSTQEPHSRRAVRSLYGLDHEPDDAELAAIAEAWRPVRTWVTVALRAVGPRLGTPSGTNAAA